MSLRRRRVVSNRLTVARRPDGSDTFMAGTGLEGEDLIVCTIGDEFVSLHWSGAYITMTRQAAQDLFGLAIQVMSRRALEGSEAR